MKVSIRLSVLTVLVSFVLAVSLLLIYGVSNKFNDKLLYFIIDDIEGVVENCEDEISNSVLSIQRANDMLCVNQKFIDLLNTSSSDVLERNAAIADLREYIGDLNSLSVSTDYGYSRYFFVDSSQPMADMMEEFTNKRLTSGAVRVYNDAGLEAEEWYNDLIANGNGEMSIFEYDDMPQYVFFAQVIENKIDYNDEVLGISLVGIDFENILRSYGNVQDKEFLEIIIVNAENEIIGTNKGTISDDVLKFASAYNTYQIQADDMTNVDIGGKEYFASMYELDFGMTLVAAVPRQEGLITIEEISHEIFWIVVLVLFVALIVAVILSGVIVRPIKRLADFMEDTDEVTDLAVKVKESFIREINSLYNSYKSMLLRIKRLIVTAENLGEQKKETEFKMLQAQINPHYLYNALDSIAWMALRRGEGDIADMAAALADSFRYNAKSSDMVIDIGSEIDFIENYVRLQEKCHKCKINFIVNAESGVEKLKIQKFMIQPLVENSIVHGLGRGNDTLTIKIDAAVKNDTLEIRVEDDGIGFDADTLNRYLKGDTTVFDTEKIGIINIYKRIKNKYGDKAELSYAVNEHNGLTAIIALPINKGEKKSEIF